MCAVELGSWPSRSTKFPYPSAGWPSQGLLHHSDECVRVARATTLAPTFLLSAGLVFRGAVAAQQLGQVLGEGGARQYHVASHFVRLLLQVALHVRQEADDRSLLQFALEFWNESQRLGVHVVHVKNDQRRLLFAVQLDPLQHIFFVL